MENNFQCTDSDTGVSIECSSETTYCQNITTDTSTFKSCGIMDFGHKIDSKDECILDFVRNFTVDKAHPKNVHQIKIRIIMNFKI